MPSKIFNVTHLTEVKLKGYPGEVTLGFLNDRMDKLPKADVVVLDIGCNDVDQPPQSNDPTVAARNTAEIVKIFLSKYGVKYVVVCKATFRVPPIRMRYISMKKYNENIETFNKILKQEIIKIPRAGIHEHREMLELADTEWTRDGLHPEGLGMKRYVQSLCRAVVNAHQFV